MQSLFFIVLYQPIFNLFVTFYRLIPDLGATILIMTIVIKVILYPFTTASMKAQKSMAELQPKIEALKKEHKDNKQKLSEETLKLYTEHRINPLGSCLPILVQLFISIALYYVLRDGLTGNNFSALYSFVQSPGHINTVSLGLFDLNKAHNIVIALLAGAAQFWQAKTMVMKRPPKEAGAGGKDEDMAAIMSKQMLYMMPAMTVIVGINLPSGLSLYWFFSTFLTALQQMFIMKKKDTNAPTDKPPVIEGTIVK